MVLATVSLQTVPQYLQASLILTLWVLLTGGLHLDGLADCADAWAGGLGDRKKTWRIMKDPAAGPVAVVVLSLTLLLKWSALRSLTGSQLFTALLAAPVLGRTAILALMCSAPYVSRHGLAEKLMKQLPVKACQGLVAMILLAGVAILGWLPLLLTIGMVAWVRKIGLIRLGGMTGDVYGSAVELVELVVLIGIAVNE